jgi:hypothetical protein
MKHFTAEAVQRVEAGQLGRSSATARSAGAAVAVEGRSKRHCSAVAGGFVLRAVGALGGDDVKMSHIRHLKRQNPSSPS